MQRTVVLSIIGTDRTAADSGYNAAKLAHEQVTLAHAPGPRILRAAQFHNLAGQMLGWYRQGDTAEIPDMPVQPVEISAVVEVLLAMATGADDRTHAKVAGPRRERMVDMAIRVDPSVTVVGVSPGPAALDGALYPGPDATIAGRDFADWLKDETTASASPVA